jgi:hypothetical protein
MKILLQRAEEWQFPLYVANMDVEGAFDNTRVSSIAAMLQRNQVPAGLRWAFLREHCAAMGHVVGAGGVSHDMERA